MNKMIMMVCPHDTAKNPDRWFRLVQYLNSHLDDISIHLDLALDFQEFNNKMNQADLVYANPNQSLELKENGYSSFVRPSNIYDEVVFIANPEMPNPTLESFQGETVATVINTLTTKLAMSILGDMGVKPAQLVNNLSWLAVIKKVSQNTPLGFVYKDTYEELSETTKKMITKVGVSSVNKLFHQFNLGGKAMAYKPNLEKLFLGMDTDNKGKDVLQELNIQSWKIPTQEEIETMEKLS